GAGIEERPQPVGCLRGGRRRNPVLAEDGVAELEGAFFLEGDVGGGLGEGIGIHALLRGAGAPLHQLELFGLREIRGRRGDRPDPGEVLRREIVAYGGTAWQVLCRTGRERREKPKGRRTRAEAACGGVWMRRARAGPRAAQKV